MASFDENGKYIKTNWKAGDRITATKLNKIEESIEAVNDNDISRHVEADTRLDALEAKDDELSEQLAQNAKEITILKTEYTNILEFGAKGDGMTDDTDAIQSAIDTGLPIFIPKTEHFYKITRPLYVLNSVKSNGAILKKDISVGSGMDKVIVINDYREEKTLTISGLEIDGNWDSVSQNDEHGHGIHIGNSKNIIIENNIIKNCYGDCIYVGSAINTSGDVELSNLGVCDNISIRNNILENPRRCNIAIVSVDNITINSNFLQSNIKYVAMIDIEPNSNGYERVRNVIIKNNNISSDVDNRFLLIYNKNENEVINLDIKDNIAKINQFITSNKLATGYLKINIDNNTIVPTSITDTIAISLTGYDSATGIEHLYTNISNNKLTDNCFVYLESIENLTISNNLFDGGNSGLTIKGCSYVSINKNNFRNITDRSMYIYGGTKEVSINLNNFSNVEKCIRTSSGLENIQIENNRFYNCSIVYETGELAGYKDLRTGKNSYIDCDTIVSNTKNILFHYSKETLNNIDNKQIFSPSKPSKGDCIIGDICYNTNPIPGSFIGWICTESGNPGTWKGFGLIEE